MVSRGREGVVVVRALLNLHSFHNILCKWPLEANTSLCAFYIVCNNNVSNQFRMHKRQTAQWKTSKIHFHPAICTFTLTIGYLHKKSVWLFVTLAGCFTRYGDLSIECNEKAYNRARDNPVYGECCQRWLEWKCPGNVLWKYCSTTFQK